MASNYGPWVGGDDWRSWVEITVADDPDNEETKSIITVRGWFGSKAGSSIGNGNVQGWVGYKIGSGSTTWSPSGTGVSIDPFSEGTEKYFRTSTWTITKAHSAQTVTGYADVEGKAGIYSGSKSQASASIIVPAKTSYAVRYNANGGSGAPASQTKWYGETLKLSTTKPTRANYIFKGWATSSSGSVEKGAGESYTEDAAVTFYAVWESAATNPSITKLTAYRSDSSGNRVTSSSTATTHITIEYGWSVDSGASSRKIQFSLGGTSKTAITLSANSGSTGKVTYTQSLGVVATLTVSATLTDVTHNLTAKRSVRVGNLFKPFSLVNGGKAAAFFGFANAAWNNVLAIYGGLRTIGYNLSVYGTTFASSDTDASSTNYNSGLVFYDSEGYWTQRFYPVKNTSGESLLIESRRNINGTNKSNQLYLGVNADGTPRMSVTSPTNWHKTISGWTSIATTTGTTAATISLGNYSELLICVKYGSTFASSIVVPVDQITTTETDWYMGGWKDTYWAGFKLTKTKITPYQVGVNSVQRNGTWTVYAR